MASVLRVLFVDIGLDPNAIDPRDGHTSLHKLMSRNPVHRVAYNHWASPYCDIMLEIVTLFRDAGFNMNQANPQLKTVSDLIETVHSIMQSNVFSLWLPDGTYQQLKRRLAAICKIAKFASTHPDDDVQATLRVFMRMDRDVHTKEPIIKLMNEMISHLHQSFNRILTSSENYWLNMVQVFEILFIQSAIDSNSTDSATGNTGLHLLLSIHFVMAFNTNNSSIIRYCL